MSAMSNTKNLAGDTKQQIKSLLSGGCTQRQAALAVGVDESYVSQLMTGDEEFATEVISARIVALKDQSARDGEYDKLEDRILKKLNDQLSMIVNPDRLVRMLSVVNGAKRRGAQADQGSGQSVAVTNVINLSLPAAIVNRYRTNTSNEVIEVNEQGMVGMPAAALLEKLRPAGQIAQLPKDARELTTSDFQIMGGDESGGGETDYELLKRKREEARLSARVKAATIVPGQEY